MNILFFMWLSKAYVGMPLIGVRAGRGNPFLMFLTNAAQLGVAMVYKNLVTSAKAIKRKSLSC